MLLNIMQSSNLKVKKRLLKLTVNSIKFINTLPNTRVYWNIVDQLIKCISSIGANINEAQGASSKRDYIKYFEIALKSSNESKYWLDVLLEIATEQQDAVNIIRFEVAEISNIIAASILTLKGKRDY